MGLLNAIGRQLQHPRGLFGKALFTWLATQTIAPARWTVDLLEVQPHDRILEVGFGTGTNLALLAQRASRGRVAGAEVSETAMEMASKRNAAAIAEGRATLHRTPGGALPFADGTFDKACTIATAYVIADPGAVFREMHRVLAPGGRAAVTFSVRENFMRVKPAGTLIGRKPLAH